MTWLKRIGAGLVAAVTVAGGSLVATCGSDGECYRRMWPGAVVQGVVGAVRETPPGEGQ